MIVVQCGGVDWCVGWGMKQLTLAAVGFERYAKTTRRAAFLAEMERVVPWSARCALSHQAGVRLCQGALSRAEEEHPSAACDLRTGQSVHGAPASPALPTGVVCPEPGRQHRADPNTALKPPNYPAPSRCGNRDAPHPCASPLFQMGYRGGSGGDCWRWRWQSFTLTLDTRSG
jgi:hypothetical protein